MSDDTVREVGRFEYWCLKVIDGAKAGGSWVGRNFSNWFANSFVMAGVFAIIVAAIGIGMYFDGEYARRWAPGESSEDIFTGYGWLISLAMVFLTAAGIKSFQDGAKWAGGIMVVAGLYFTVLSVTQSIGVVTLKAQEMIAAADAFDAVEDTDTNRMDELKAQRDQKIKDRDSEITRIEGSIADIRNDGVVGIPQKDLNKIDKLNQDIADLRVTANTEIQTLDAAILAELVTPGDEAVVAVAPPRFDAGIDFWAYVLTLGEPTVEYKTGLTYWYMLFWSIGCPIMGQMLSCYLVATRRTRALANKNHTRTVRLKDGQSAMLFDSQAERDEYEDLLTRGRNSKAGVEKRESTMRRRDKRIEALDYYSEKITEALDRATRLKWKPQGIADSVFNMSLGEMIHMLEQQLDMGRISQADYDLITGGQIVNGKDKFTDDEGGDDADDTQPTASA